MDIKEKIFEEINKSFTRNLNPSLLILGYQKYCDLLNHTRKESKSKAIIVDIHYYHGLKIIRALNVDESYLIVI